jgi:hypothetical protein
VADFQVTKNTKFHSEPQSPAEKLKTAYIRNVSTHCYTDQARTVGTTARRSPPCAMPAFAIIIV